MLVANDDLVKEGSPVVLLHSPRADRRADDPERPMSRSFSCRRARGRRSMSAIGRGEPGDGQARGAWIHSRAGRAAIWEMPATKLAMEAALEHPELAEAFFKRYAPGVLLRVHVKLGGASRSDAASAVQPALRSRKPLPLVVIVGASQPLKTGTMCQAAIVVEKQRLIKLILPWTKKARRV